MPARPTVIFDFDGTIALGRGPLEAYVNALRNCAGDDTAQAALAAVVTFDEGMTTFRDAYHAVRETAIARGITDDTLNAAYRASREVLATEAAPIHAPDGLADFLTELSTSAHCVLATNAPATGIDRALRVLGADSAITEQHHDVGKPAGLTPILRTHLAHGPVMSVGDIWENDLAPAAALNAETALVGVGASPQAHPTLRGTDLTELFDDLLTWATENASALTH